MASSTSPVTMAEAIGNSDDAAPTLIVEAASPCKILVANPAWCALMGYRPEDVAGQPISLLHGPLTCGETLTALGMSMGAGQSLRVMLVSYTKERAPFLNSLSSSPLLDSESKPTFFRWVVTPHSRPLAESPPSDGEGSAAPLVPGMGLVYAKLQDTVQQELARMASAPPVAAAAAVAAPVAVPVTAAAAPVAVPVAAAAAAIADDEVKAEAAAALVGAKRAASSADAGSRKRPASGSSSASAPRIAPFVRKLYDMVSAGNDCIRWAQDGTSFWIGAPDALESTVLPRFFKHNRMAFFVKQLKAYGFCAKRGASCLDVSKEWFHKAGAFYRGGEESLVNIQRTSAPSRSLAANTAGSGSSAEGAALAAQSESPPVTTATAAAVAALPGGSSSSGLSGSGGVSGSVMSGSGGSGSGSGKRKSASDDGRGSSNGSSGGHDGSSGRTSSGRNSSGRNSSERTNSEGRSESRSGSNGRGSANGDSDSNATSSGRSSSPRSVADLAELSTALEAHRGGLHEHATNAFAMLDAIAARLGQNRASGPPPEVGETPSTAAVAATEGISILGSQMEGIAA